MTGCPVYVVHLSTQRPWLTVLRGQVFFAEGKLQARPGTGRYLARGRPLLLLARAVR